MNWEAALAEYDRDLRARGAAERTRRAYAVDLGGFVEWVRAAGARARRRAPPRRAPLRRRALRGRRGAGDGRPQAGRDPRPLRLPRPHRAGRAEPGRAGLQPEARREAAEGADHRADALAAGADPGPHAAGAARPGDAGAGLLLRPALRGDRQPRPAARSTSRPSSCGCSARAPRSGSCRSASRRSGRCERYIAARPPARWRPIRASGRCSSPRAAAASPTPTSPAGSASGPARRRWPPGSRRIHFAIHSPPICSRVAPICVPFRSCLATHRSRPPRFTPESTPPACATPMPPATPARDPMTPAKRRIA